MATNAIITAVTSGAKRYSIVQHKHPRKILIHNEYESSVDGTRVIAFTCLCCDDLYIEVASSIHYTDYGLPEPDLVSPVVRTEF